MLLNAIKSLIFQCYLLIPKCLISDGTTLNPTWLAEYSNFRWYGSIAAPDHRQHCTSPVEEVGASIRDLALAKLPRMKWFQWQSSPIFIFFVFLFCLDNINVNLYVYYCIVPGNQLDKLTLLWLSISHV